MCVWTAVHLDRVARLRRDERDIVTQDIDHVCRSRCLADRNATRTTPDRNGLWNIPAPCSGRRVTPVRVQHRHGVRVGIGNVKGRGCRIQCGAAGVCTDGHHRGSGAAPPSVAAPARRCVDDGNAATLPADVESVMRVINRDSGRDGGQRDGHWILRAADDVRAATRRSVDHCHAPVRADIDRIGRLVDCDRKCSRTHWGRSERMAAPFRCVGVAGLRVEHGDCSRRGVREIDSLCC